MTQSKTVHSAEAETFIHSILEKKPRLAVFDCDATLWNADSGVGFFFWEIERGLVSPEVATKLRARYEQYRAGQVSEDDMCGEMVTMHAGISSEVIERAAAEFFPPNIAPLIFPEMKSLTFELKAAGCDVWAISSTNDWVVRNGVREFGIDADHVLAVSVEIEDGLATDRLIRIPSGEGKATAIREVIRRMPDVAFGNSKWDQAMLELARYPYAINPNPDLESVAKERGWAVYWPGQ